jgi:hypothetical protein
MTNGFDDAWPPTQSILLLGLYGVYVAVVIGQEAMRKRTERQSASRPHPPYRYVPIVSDMNEVGGVAYSLD